MIPRHKETTGPNGGKKVWFRVIKYLCEYWTQQKIRGNHFQELVKTHPMNVLDFLWDAELHRRRRYPGTKKPQAHMEEKRRGSRQMKYICEYWTQQKIRGNHFQELVNTHLMNVLIFPGVQNCTAVDDTPAQMEEKGMVHGNEIYM